MNAKDNPTNGGVLQRAAASVLNELRVLYARTNDEFGDLSGADFLDEVAELLDAWDQCPDEEEQKKLLGLVVCGGTLIARQTGFVGCACDTCGSPYYSRRIGQKCDRLIRKKKPKKEEP